MKRHRLRWAGPSLLGPTALPLGAAQVPDQPPAPSELSDRDLITRKQVPQFLFSQQLDVLGHRRHREATRVAGAERVFHWKIVRNTGIAAAGNDEPDPGGGATRKQ